MQRNILSGSEFLLYNIDDEPVAYSKNCAIKINQTLIDVTTKSSDSWSDFMVGIKDWSIEFEGLVSYGDGFNSDYFVNKYHSREPFFIRFGVIQDNFTHAFYGEVHIANIDQTADDGDAATFSGSLKGIGNLSFTNEGSPEQSGYLKTETDPIFRGSPAFTITDADKAKWHEANNKIVEQIQFVSSGSTTTLKMKFKDGNQYSTSFQNINSVDLSGYYTKAEADTKIQTAQVAADTANTLLYNISNDSKLTPNEKVSVLKEWLVIQDEKPKLVQQAAIFGIETLDYDVAFIDLDEYLDPLLVSMEVTSDIQGFQLRNTFRAYYDQKVLLLKAITEAGKNHTDAIEIGGRNYHFNGDQSIYVQEFSNEVLQTGNYPVNSQMAISFYARTSSGDKILNLEFDGQQGVQFNVNQDWKRFTGLLNTGGIQTLYARLDQQINIQNFGIQLFSFDEPFATNSSFPYSFPMDFDHDEISEDGAIEIKYLMVILGNKPMDFINAPEDFLEKITQAKAEAATAANAYAIAQRVLAETNAAALLDGRIDELEQITIDLAETNLEVAKQYAEVQATNARALAQIYADGKVDAIELQIIDASNGNIQAAKDYSDAQIALSEIATAAMIDGKIDEVEAALIENAEDNLAAAKAFSQAQDLLTKTLIDASVDGKISNEEQARITAVQNSLNAAKAYTEAQRTLSETIIKAYADGIVSDEEARAIADAQVKLNAAKAYADQKALDLKTEIIDILDQSILDKANEIIANTTAQINVANTTTLQAAEADAEAKATIAKNAAIASANTFATAERILAETNASAYADGIVTAEEQARINQAANNLQAAKDDATNKSNAAAQYGIAAQNLHTALVGNLRSLAYEDVVEVSKLGSTIVTGGLIKTSLLDANYIKSDIINSTYINTLSLTASTITATTGKIGTWDISNFGLKDTTGTAYILSSIPYSGGGKTEVGIGLNAASSSNPDLPNFGSNYFASKFLSTSNRSNGINTAIYSEASGGSLGNFALHANGSVKIENGNLSLGSGSKIFTSGQEGITDDIGIKVQDARTGGQERVYSMHIRNGLIVGFTYVG